MVSAFAVVALAMTLLSQRIPFGRRLYALGSNPTRRR